MPKPGKRNPSVPIGATAVELVRYLASRRPPDDTFLFMKYTPSKGVAQRLRIRPGRKLFSKTAEELWRHAKGDAALLAKTLVGKRVADKRKLKPMRRTARVIARPRSSFLPPTQDTEAVAICSTVRCRRGELQLPMLDFRTEAPADEKAGKRTISVLCAALAAVRAPAGVLLHSGKSYHYYGYEPLALEEWRDFLQRCLLLEPLTDIRYISHRLLSGRATLRICRSSTKPTMPRVVAHVRGTKRRH